MTVTSQESNKSPFASRTQPEHPSIQQRVVLSWSYGAVTRVSVSIHFETNCYLRSWFHGVPSIEQDKLIGFWFKHLLIEQINFLRQWRDVSFSCCSVLVDSAYMGEAASHKEIKWLALSVRVTDTAQWSSCGGLGWDGLVRGIVSCPEVLKR